MIGIDHFSSTVRGLFLSPGALAREAREVPLAEAPLPAGAAAVVEVASVPPGCEVDHLEVIEPAPGRLDAFRTREVPVEAGRRLVVAIGGRFANRGIHGRAPEGPARAGDPLDLLNTGGVCGRSLDPDRPVVKLTVRGGVEWNGSPALLSDLWTIPRAQGAGEEGETPEVPLVLLTGSEMDVGKTTCASSLAFALRSAGIRVSFAKLTGTGRMKDLMRVCYGRPLGLFHGDRPGWDFVDAGLATTSGVSPRDIRFSARSLLRHAAKSAEIVLAEIADAPVFDGSFHAITDPWMLSWLRERGLVICACENVESTLTVHWLRSHLDLDNNHILISGLVANRPRFRQEVERMTGVSACSCTSPGSLSPLGASSAGGALADWTLKHVMALRRAVA